MGRNLRLLLVLNMFYSFVFVFEVFFVDGFQWFFEVFKFVFECVSWIL